MFNVTHNGNNHLKGDVIIMSNEQRELAKLLSKNCTTMEDVQNLLKDTAEEMLESEMDEHLGYDKNSVDGRKEILGLWLSDNESATFGLSVCNELKNRGVQDIFIACRDNLTGFSSAISTAFSETEQQLCIIHQIRNSTKYVSYKDLKPIMADLKLIYKASTLDEAEYQLLSFEEKRNKKYPQIAKSWRENWTELSAYFNYPEEVRRLIYTTNAVEGFHRMLRKITKTKTSYPTDESLKKSIYLSITEISKKWNMPVRDWGIITGQLSIYFEDRIKSLKVS
jgi:putative transposase